MVIIKQILNSFLFWGGWIIIPFIMEIVPALGSVFLLIRRNLRHKKKRKEMKIYPEISLIIPVYNSADTLYGCIKSVNDSTYLKGLVHKHLGYFKASSLPSLSLCI